MTLQWFRNGMSGFIPEICCSKQQIHNITDQPGLGGASGGPVPPQSRTNFKVTLGCTVLQLLPLNVWNLL